LNNRFGAIKKPLGILKRIFNTLLGGISGWKNPPNVRWTKKKNGNTGKRVPVFKFRNGFAR